MVSKASEDLPEPDSPVKTTNRSRGISRSMFLRLCSRAPRIEITRPPSRLRRGRLSNRSVMPDFRVVRAMILAVVHVHATAISAGSNLVAMDGVRQCAKGLSSLRGPGMWTRRRPARTFDFAPTIEPAEMTVVARIDYVGTCWPLGARHRIRCTRQPHCYLFFLAVRNAAKRKGPAKLPALSPQREPPAHHRPNRILNVNCSNFINYATSA